MSLNAVPPVLAAHVLAALGVGSITGAHRPPPTLNEKATPRT